MRNFNVPLSFYAIRIYARHSSSCMIGYDLLSYAFISLYVSYSKANANFIFWGAAI